MKNNLMNKKNIWIILKFLISILFIYLLSRTISIEEIVATFNNINYLIFLVALIFAVFRNIFASLRMKVLLRSDMHKGQDISIGRLFQFTLMGIYFNFLLPSSIGGDVARTWFLSNEKLSVQKSASIVIVEKLLGLLALFITIEIGFVFGSGQLAISNQLFQITQILFLFFIIGMGILYFLIQKEFFNLLNTKFVQKVSMNRKIRIQEIKDVISNHYNIFMAILYSVLLQISTAFSLVLFALAAKTDISIYSSMIATSLSQLVALIPISLNGLGLRENTVAYILQSLEGIGLNSTAILSFLNLLGLIFTGIIGWVIFSMNPQAKEATKLE